MEQVLDAKAAGQRIEEILAELDGLGDPRVRERAEELVRTLVEFYGAGLTRTVELLRQTGHGAGTELVGELAADPLVGSLLVVHDLHPLSTRERVVAALEKVRPYLGSHAGDVDLLAVEDDTVYLRLAGSCNGCPSSEVTVKLAIEQAIQEAAPEIVGIEVEGVAPEPVRGEGPGGRTLLPLVTANGQDTTAAAPAAPTVPASWVEVDGADDTAPGSVRGLLVGETSAVFCNVSGTLYAYRDRCPACGSALAGGRLTEALLACPDCGTGYDVTLAGRAVADGAGHLDPLPLLTDQGSVRVALPAMAAR